MTAGNCSSAAWTVGRCLRSRCSPGRRSSPGVRRCCSNSRCSCRSGWTRPYDIAPDGRFLIIRSGQAEAGGGTAPRCRGAELVRGAEASGAGELTSAVRPLLDYRPQRLLRESRPVFGNPPSTRSNRTHQWGDELPVRTGKTRDNRRETISRLLTRSTADFRCNDRGPGGSVRAAAEILGCARSTCARWNNSVRTSPHRSVRMGTMLMATRGYWAAT